MENYIYGIALICAPISFLILFTPPTLYAKFRKVSHKTETLFLSLYHNFIEKKLQVDNVFVNLKIFRSDEKIIKQHLEDTYYLDHQELNKEENFHLITSITTLCHYPKMAKVERCILKFMQHCGVNLEKTHNQWQVLQAFPSNHEKKFSSVVAQNRTTKEIISFAKGNTTEILKCCGRIIDHEKKLPLDEQALKKINHYLQQLKKKGEKVIAFAYKPLPLKQLNYYYPDFAEQDMVLIGLIGLRHPKAANLDNIIKKARKLDLKFRIFSDKTPKKTEHLINQIGWTNPTQYQMFEYSDFPSVSLDNQKDIFFCKFSPNEISKISKSLVAPGKLQKIVNSIETLRMLFKNKHSILKRSVAIQVLLLFSFIFANMISQKPIITWQSILFLQAIVFPITISYLFFLNETENNNNQIIYSSLLAKIFTLGLILWIVARDITHTEISAFLLTSLIIFHLVIVINFQEKQNKIALVILLFISSLFIILINTNLNLQNILNLTPLSIMDWSAIALASLSLFSAKFFAHLVSKRLQA